MAFSLVKLCTISSVAFLLSVTGPGWLLPVSGLALAQSNAPTGVDSQKKAEPAQKTTEKPSQNLPPRQRPARRVSISGFETLECLGEECRKGGDG